VNDFALDTSKLTQITGCL